MTKKTAKIFQFKIQLNHIKPLIWRRVQISSTDTFADFHDVIQHAMGWEQCHLHEFRINGKFGAEGIGPIFDDGFECPTNEKKVKLDKIFTHEQQKITYEYDFGDGWEHTITLEKIVDPDEKSYPRCVAGERACPPEDCGGPWGYENLLEILGDPKHEEHNNMLEWCGKIDPEAFSVETTNKFLRNINGVNSLL